MPTVYTPDPTTFHPDITVPSDGDAETAESVNAALRALADDVAEARSHVSGSAVDTTIGASSLDTLDVKAAATFEQPVTLVGGASLDVSGTVTVADTLTANGDFEANGIAEFQGNATFNAPATFNGNTTIGSDAADALDVKATATFEHGVTLEGTTNVEGVMQPTNKIVMSAAGRIVERPSWILSGVGNTTIGPASGGSGSGADHMFMGLGTPTASRKLIIDDTDAVNGDQFMVTNLDTTYAVSVRYPDDSNTVGSALLNAATGSSPFAAIYKRIGGVWYQILVSRGAP